MSNHNDNKNMDLTIHHTLQKRLLRMAKILVEDDEIKIIGIRSSISRKFPPIGRSI